jgi:hypothetical protein
MVRRRVRDEAGDGEQEDRRRERQERDVLGGGYITVDGALTLDGAGIEIRNVVYACRHRGERRNRASGRRGRR